MKVINVFRTLAAVAIATLGLAAPSHAAVTAALSAGTTCGGATSANYSTSGAVVKVSLCVSATTEPLCGTSYRFVSANAGENGRFNITARALGPNYSFSNVATVNFPIPINNTATGDLGAGTASNTPVAAAPNQLIATFDLAPQANATNAAYVISLDTAGQFSKAFVDTDGTCAASTNAPLTASFTLNLSVTPTAPVFTSAAPPAGATGTAYTHTFTASGNPAPTFAVTTGSLPAGLSLATGGALTGTPTVSGTFNFTVTATNSAGTAAQPVTLIINGPPGAPTVTASAGNSQATLTITAPANTGGSALTGYTATCSPNAGTDANAGTLTTPRVITGLVNGTSHTCSVTATNAGGFTSAAGVTSAFTPSLAPVPPAFTSAASNPTTGAGSFTVGTAGSTFNITASGVPTPTISQTGGALPTGVTFTSGGANSGTATLAGTPTQAGTFNLTFAATSTTSPAASQSFTFTVNKANQTITFGAIASQPFNASPIALNATTTATGLSVAFSSTTPGVCTVSGSSASFVSAGTCTIVASQAGNANFNAATPVTQSFTVTASAPGAPVIGAGQPGNMQAIINFSPPSVNGGSAIIDYTATCTGGAGGTATGTSSPITVSGLVNGTTYSCSVTARNVSGSGPASGSVSVTPAPIVPPGPPVISSAMAGNGLAIISFGPPASNGGSAITSYRATCNPGAISATGTSSPITVTGLTNNTTYTCSVTATNIAGTGQPSATVTVTPRNVPITLQSTTGVAAYGASVTLVASVTGNGQTGTVSFSVDSGNGIVVLPGCAAVPLVSGSASCIAPGANQTQNPRQYQATYSGDANNGLATTTLAQVVAVNTAVLTVTANPLPPVVSGRTATLTALVRMNNPTGTVTFFDNAVPVTGCEQKAVAIVPDATDAAVVTCTVTVPASPGGAKQYVATYFYPAGHVSGRVFEQTVFDLRVVASGPADYTDMWWAGASENGWGMSVTQHGPIQFNVIFAYDNLGKALWYVMPGGSFNAAGNVFTGALFLPTSSPFSAYDKSKFVMGAPVGSATITYNSSSTATLAYTINGVSASKSIQRQIFAPETTGPNLRTNDLWWATFAEDGWGMNIAQQGRVLFPVWYTYDAAGKATFFTAQGGSWNGTVWSGTVYSHEASAWLGVPYNPALFKSTNVGTISLDFSDASNATMTTTVNGIAQVRRIERQPY